MARPHYLSLAGLLAARKIRDADVLLWRRGAGLASRVIAAIGRGEYSHAALACWLGRELLALEVVQFAGGRAQPLAAQVARWPGRVDWYEVHARDAEFDLNKAAHRMVGLTGAHYGWWSLARLALRRLPVVRLFARPPTDDDLANGYAPFCSQAVSIALRAGGLDPVPNLADCFTEPADLARSPLLVYRGTLIP